MTDGYVGYHKEVGIHMESSVWAAMYSIFVYICCVFCIMRKMLLNTFPLIMRVHMNLFAYLERRLYHYGLQN